MNSKAKEILIVSVISIIGIYFFTVGLVEAAGFLAPLSIAVLLTMVLIPISRKLETWGVPRGFAAFICVLMTIIAFSGLFTVLSLQVSSIVEDWPKIQKTLEPKVVEFQKFVEKNTGMSPSDQIDLVEKKMPVGEQSSEENSDEEKADDSRNSSGSESSNENPEGNSVESPQSSKGGSSKLFGLVGDALMTFFSFFGTSLLVFIYMFFFLLYRRKMKLSILKFFSKNNREEAKLVFNQAINLSQNYLIGRLLLIMFLAIIYSIGMSVSGVQSAILISILAALLSLVPYVGVLIGYVLAMAMAAFSGGDTMMFVGVTITYSIAQFVESYILEPYVVGKKVDLNPLITILVVVLGGAIWGITGMIISIPVFGIFKIIFDHIPVLNPLGYMLGEEDIGTGDDDSIFEKAGKRIKDKFTKSNNSAS